MKSIRDFLVKNPNATNEEIFAALSKTDEAVEDEKPVDDAKDGEVQDTHVEEPEAEPVV